MLGQAIIIWMRRFICMPFRRRRSEVETMALLFNRTMKGRRLAWLTIAGFLLAPAAWAQETKPPSSATQNTQKPAAVPDAPSAVKPPSPFGSNAQTNSPARPTPPNGVPAAGDSTSAVPNLPQENTPTPAESAPVQPQPASANAAGPPETHPAGEDSRNDFTIQVQTNFVVVPVTVKDHSGRMIDGLLKRDFVVMEDGAPQNVQLFTSDPFPLSAALVVDTGMDDLTLHRVQDSLPALAGAFSQYDELSVFTYATAVQKLGDFTPAGTQQLDTLLRKVQYVDGSQRRTGQQGGVPFAGGPLNSPPTINGQRVDPNAAVVPIVEPDARVLNDALLAAANELSARPRARRRIIFLVSDGRENRSRASYNDVLKVLLSHEITVYALAVGNAAIPGYGRAEKFHIHGTAYGDIIGKYVGATGGDVITEFSRKGIEQAYAQATQEARNQYTLGYTTRSTAASNYREIEVRVHRPNLVVTAKTGYYPLPPARSPNSPAVPAKPPSQ